MLMSKEICHQRTEQFWPAVHTQQPRSQLKALEKKTPGFQKKCEKTQNLGPKNGYQKWTQIWGSALALQQRILLKPDSEAQFWVPKTEPKMGPKIEQKSKKN